MPQNSDNKDEVSDVFLDLASNIHLLGFNNGVFNLQTCEFYPKSPADIITKSVGYDYPFGYSTCKADLMQFLLDIVPDADNLKFLLKYIASGFDGNREHMYLAGMGNGSNGKTTFERLTMNTLGNYSKKHSDDLLIQDTLEFDDHTLTVPQPNPYILHLQEARIVFGSDESNIDTNTINLLTGVKDTRARNINEDYTIIKSKFKMIVMFNSVPEIIISEEEPQGPIGTPPTLDDSPKPQIIYFPFETNFVHNPEKDNEKKCGDYGSMVENMELWKQDFMLLLLEAYKIYHEEGLELSTGVKKFTQKCNNG
jgi:hypothetical protein